MLCRSVVIDRPAVNHQYPVYCHLGQISSSEEVVRHHAVADVNGISGGVTGGLVAAAPDCWQSDAISVRSDFLSSASVSASPHRSEFCTRQQRCVTGVDSPPAVNGAIHQTVDEDDLVLSPSGSQLEFCSRKNPAELLEPDISLLEQRKRLCCSESRLNGGVGRQDGNGGTVPDGEAVWNFGTLKELGQRPFTYPRSILPLPTSKELLCQPNGSGCSSVEQLDLYPTNGAAIDRLCRSVDDVDFRQAIDMFSFLDDQEFTGTAVVS
jgi:hypothetical protein